YPPVYTSFFTTTTALPDFYTLSLHDALPISFVAVENADIVLPRNVAKEPWAGRFQYDGFDMVGIDFDVAKFQNRFQPCRSHRIRSEEHTSELQSRGHLVCRLLLEKKKIKNKH